MNAQVNYVIKNARCCRIWPIVTETFTHGNRGLKHETWWWRVCGLYGKRPVLVNE